MGISMFARTVIDQTRAQITADASALAAIYGGEPSARVVALRNNGSVVSFSKTAGIVRVEIRTGSQSASALARESWVVLLPTLVP